jgi:hypothetical protein
MKENDKNKFKVRNKEIKFVMILLLTIVVTRIITDYKDLDLRILGYELHHFYYGLALLIIINLAMLFGRHHPRLYTYLSAFALGLVADELLFIMGGYLNHEYPSTFTHSIFIMIVIISILAIIIYDFLGIIKERKK